MANHLFMYLTYWPIRSESFNAVRPVCVFLSFDVLLPQNNETEIFHVFFFKYTINKLKPAERIQPFIELIWAYSGCFYIYIIFMCMMARAFTDNFHRIFFFVFAHLIRLTMNEIKQRKKNGSDFFFGLVWFGRCCCCCCVREYKLHVNFMVNFETDKKVR